jgi:hypothetical protein
MRKFRTRLASEWLAVTGSLVLLVALAATLGWFARADLVLYDLALKSWQRPAPTDIVIVAVDEGSLAAVGRWPWRRAVTAALLDRVSAASPKAIGLDILLVESDPNDVAGDKALADAIARSGRVVLPVVGEAGHGQAAFRSPPPAFAKGAAALGHGHVVLDSDGIARSVWLVEGPEAAELEHFAYGVLRVAEPKAFPSWASPELGAPHAIKGWQRAWPMLIPYAGPPGHFRTVSAADVLRGTVPAETFRNNLVLIGVTAAGIGDNNPVPTSGNGRVMAGVEISANAVDALRRGIALRPFPSSLSALASALLVFALLLGLRRFSARTGLIFSGALGLALLAGSILLLRFGQAWFPPAAAMVGCALGYPLWSWRRLESAQRYLDGELAQLMREGSVLEPVVALPAGDALEQRIALIRAAAQRQKDDRRFVADALESLPVGVLVADRSGQVVLTNSRASRLLGLRQGQMVQGVPLPEILARLNPVSGEKDARLGDGGSWRALKMEVSSRAAPALLLDVAPCRDEGGRYLGLIASLTDVSELRAARKSRDDAMRFLSHDLRSPLATIVTLLEAAGEEEGERSSPELLERIGRYARRSLALADDMLRLGRVEAADPKAFRDLDLRAVLTEAADEVWPVGQARDVQVKCELDDGTDGGEEEALVCGDGELLRRAFVNLLGNAVKFSSAGSSVRLTLADEGERWKVVVADEGPGIAPENLPNLFTRYGRFPVSQEYVEGVGLGLVIVKAVADTHGGSVEVDSAPGRGTRFLFWLPKVEKDEATESAEELA